MTVDKAKLQALAEAAKAGGAEWSDLDINTERMYPAEGSLVELYEFATPAVLVELLAANALAEEARDLYLADKKRLLNEVNDLRASIQGLKTGYEAYERVNAELRAENEALKKRLAPVDNFNRQQVPVIGYTGCLVCGQFTDHGGLPCPKTSATAWASASKEQSHD